MYHLDDVIYSFDDGSVYTRKDKITHNAQGAAAVALVYGVYYMFKRAKAKKIVQETEDLLNDACNRLHFRTK